MKHEVREPVQVYGKRRLTEEEFLEWIETQDRVYEYYDGEVYPVDADFNDKTCESTRHEAVCMNLNVLLSAALKGRPCRPFGSKFQLKIDAANTYTFPDLTVVCQEQNRPKASRDMDTSPTLIIEVASPSTANYDRGGKFDYYQQLPSLKEFVAIEATIARVHIFRRDGEQQWFLQTISGIDQVIELRSIAVSLSLTEVYEDVELDTKLKLRRGGN